MSMGNLRGYKLFSLRNIDIELHITWVIFFIIIFIIDLGNGFKEPLSLVLLMIFLIVIIHEMGHSVTAQAYGIEVKRIVLTPIGGVAMMQVDGSSPKVELVVAIMGPVTNLVMAFIAVGLGADISSISLGLNELTMSYQGFLNVFLSVNIVLMLFNLIPAWPLDGGRVIRAIFTKFKGLYEGTQWAVNLSKVLMIMLAIGALLTGNFMLLIIVYLLFNAGKQELEMLEYKQVARRYFISPSTYYKTIPEYEVEIPIEDHSYS